ncbi:MAG: chromosome segregation protein SMC [Candidatus Polarisedimenticolaceae bacterium]|nr:chromosome segregation protein SMC [Candidatus Polarisedimenticolaceae bacterium]
MRLEKIKLAGFKSFVDPTTVHMPSNLIGVVGPNGCGKSNVIDAVRWVMGESSAKMLRGESMADVIFNGSSARKPVGTATVELIFDNNDGSAGGQYAQYSQISVKRQVSRDGQSSYFLNSVRCRRRDITDLFHGTGLGPRSYSIIEQGMISRFIEARPEEMRLFLEEAAGISRYKDRRRETQNRISHTRENLERLNDLREEVTKQLAHLKRQAATAERYQQLKQSERRTKAELLALRWQALDDESALHIKSITERETSVEASMAEQRRLEAEIELAREKQTETHDQFNSVQGDFYAIGAEISTLEQAIQFARDSRRQLEQDLAKSEQAWQQASHHREQDERKLADLNQTLTEDEPKLQQTRQLEQQASSKLDESELQMQNWQSEWDQFNQQATQPAQTVQVERSRINQLEQQLENLKRRTERLDEEFSRLADEGLSEEIAALELLEEESQTLIEQQQGELTSVTQHIRQQREDNSQLTQTLNSLRAELQTSKGRHASLETLQQAALGKQKSDLTGWLEAHDLAQATRLAEHLTVEPRWQQAVEMVLGHHLQAICVDRLDMLTKQDIDTLLKGTLTLFEKSSLAHQNTDETLISKVEAPWSLQAIMGDIWLADDFEQALERRSQLNESESVITPDGIWLGHNWLRLVRDADEKSGVLAREQLLKELEQKSATLTIQSDASAEQLALGEGQLKEAEQQRDQLQQRHNELNRKLSDIRQNLSGKRARAEQLTHRRENIVKDKQEVAEQIEICFESQEEARLELHVALEEMENLTCRRETLVKQRDELRDALTTHRLQSTEQRNRAHQLALQISTMRTSRDAIKQNLERTHQQLEQLTERREELSLMMEEHEEPLLVQADELELKLGRRIEVERALAEVRNALEVIDKQLRELEQKRHSAEQTVQERHALLEQARLAHQEVKVRADTIGEQLKEAKFETDELLSDLPGEANIKRWQHEVEQLATRIQRLGPINLAAISEYEEQAERMEYLDTQYADITDSLDTLENAIRKIDRETRTKFKETFDKVNTGLQLMFPKLFGGGHAYLQLTGDDLLDTGISVMARPPGKRNASIHLLSGGEKALTAVALVFAIFKLNPAPFCMLDEVDAPLDDANVGRFCELVKSMSEHVQFIFITHNKITMEIAHQLTGVTMHEPGVSRLVTVDVEEAAQMTSA